MLRPPYRRYQRLYTYHLDLDRPPRLTDPDLIGTWIEDGTAVLFFHRPKERLIAELCRRTGGRLLYQADLDYQDWEAGQGIDRFQVGPLTVAPIWEPDGADILLDPSVVFGSGFHPSTRLCLEGLLRLSRNTPPEAATSSRVLDLGCGTGLLAIAAARLGWNRILAMDYNPLAREVAQANVGRNRVAHQVEVVERDLRRQPVDTAGVELVMANLYKGLLKELFGQDSFWQANNYLLSGFVPAMEEELLAALPDHRSFRLVDRRCRDRWCLWWLQVVRPSQTEETRPETPGGKSRSAW